MFYQFTGTGVWFFQKHRWWVSIRISIDGWLVEKKKKKKTSLHPTIDCGIALIIWEAQWKNDRCQNSKDQKFEDSIMAVKMAAVNYHLASVMSKGHWDGCNKLLPSYIGAMSWENLFLPCANNKGADQPAHPCSLISAFVVRCLDSIISLVSISEISNL